MPHDLTPYVPKLVLEWEERAPDALYQKIEGTLAFIDLSGFTSMSEKLARKGKEGSEEVTEIIGATFSSLLTNAYQAGGALLKFGGDALLLFFEGDEHAARAAFAAFQMRRTLRTIGNIKTTAGAVQLKMSVGMNSGVFDFFLVGGSHRELIIKGPQATLTVEMESTAEAGEILLSPSTAAELPSHTLGGEKGNGILLVKSPDAPSKVFEVDVRRRHRPCSQFVPVAIRNYLEAGGSESEHRLVSVAFLHFYESGGSGGIAQEASELQKTINAIQEISEANGVTFLGTDIDKDGGKIILVSGAPVASDNDEERLLRCVREVVDGAGTIGLSAGINHGYVFTGDIGPYYRRTYTVMGDAVNTAARILARAHVSQILTAPSVLQRSQSEFEILDRVSFQAKGKAKQVVAHELGALKRRRNPMQLRQLPLTGREAEISLLFQRMERAKAGSGGVITIVGEAGAGKTRLVEELREQRGDLLFLFSEGNPYESSTPYSAFRPVLTGLLRHRFGSHESDVEALTSALRTETPDLLPWLSLLAIPLGLSLPPSPEVSRLDEAHVGAQLRRVVKEFLTRLLPSSAIWFFDDADWMDQASSEMLKELMPETSDRGWLFILTRRRDSGEELPTEVSADVIALSPLTLDAAATLARKASEDLLPSQALKVAETSGGNPLFLLELAQGSTDDGDDLPQTVEQLIAAKIDQLDPPDRALLRIASVLGRSFPSAQLEQISPSGKAGKDVPLERLNEFVTKQNGMLRFVVPLFQQVAYEGLSFQKKRLIHRQVGEYLESSMLFEDESPELLSYHFFHANAYEKAWRYSLVAGEQASSKHAHLDATSFYRRALKVVKYVAGPTAVAISDVWLALGQSLVLAGQLNEAPAAYKEARRLAGDDATRLAHLTYLESRVREQTGKFAQSVRYARKALDLSRSVEEPTANVVRARLYVTLAAVRYRQGKLREAKRYGFLALKEGEAAQSDELIGHSANVLYPILSQLGDESAESYAHLAISKYEMLQNPRFLGMVLNNVGHHATDAGRWHQAEEHLRRAAEAMAVAGNPVNAANVAINQAEILSNQGQWARAIEIVEDALSIFRAAKSERDAIALYMLGKTLTRAGKVHEGLAKLQEALDLYEARRTEGSTTRVFMAEGFVLAGEPLKALEILQPLIGKTSAKITPVALRIMGYIWLLTDHPKEAIEAFEESVALASSLGMEYEMALSLKAKAEAVATENPRQASKDKEQAEEILRRLGIVATPQIPVRPRPDSAVSPA